MSLGAVSALTAKRFSVEFVNKNKWISPIKQDIENACSAFLRPM